MILFNQLVVLGNLPFSALHQAHVCRVMLKMLLRYHLVVILWRSANEQPRILNREVKWNIFFSWLPTQSMLIVTEVISLVRHVTRSLIIKREKSSSLFQCKDLIIKRGKSSFPFFFYLFTAQSRCWADVLDLPGFIQRVLVEFSRQCNSFSS